MLASRRKTLCCIGGGAAAMLASLYLRPHQNPELTISTDRIREQLLETPRPISPTGDLSHLVPRDLLRKLLAQMIPVWDSIKTSRVLHAFRLWGPTVTFPTDAMSVQMSGKVFSGDDLTRYLLDQRFYSSLLPAEEPLLFRSEWGAAVRNSPSRLQGQFVQTLVHPDDLLTACAEVGLPASHAIYAANLKDGGVFSGTIADLIADSVARFSLNQELPWTVEAYARYFPPSCQWANRFGETTTFDSAANAILNQQLGSGACLGTHTVYSLVCLLRLGDGSPMLSQSMRRKIEKHLRDVIHRMDRSISGTGLWAGKWWEGKPPDPAKSSSEFADLAATAHHLEWIAIAPPDLRPAVGQIEDVMYSIARMLSDHWLSRYARTENYLNLSHLARALCLLRCVEPGEFISTTA